VGKFYPEVALGAFIVWSGRSAAGMNFFSTSLMDEYVLLPKKPSKITSEPNFVKSNSSNGS
jgi:hypothetical protein